jgi:hypothetical protein
MEDISRADVQFADEKWALFAHRDLDAAERFLQRALALHPASRARYLGILGSSGCVRESPNRSLLPWTRQSADPFDGI